MKKFKFSQQVIGEILVGLLLVGCSTPSTLVPTIETVEPNIEPTFEPTDEPTDEPTIEPTDVPTETAPISAKVLLLGSEGSYIDMYPQPSSPLTPFLQVAAGVECEVLSGPRIITDITLWEIDCSWSDEIDTEGYGLKGWVDIKNLELID